MPANLRALAPAAGFLLLAAACGEAVTGVTVVDDLVPVAPAEVGLDDARLDGLVRDIQGGRYGEVHSLLIVRRGRLAVEEYFNGASASETHTLQSVSKSVTSAGIGIAIERGALDGVDERVVDFFPQWREELIQDERRARQTIEHILTMRTGTDYVEGFDGSPHSQLNALPTGWDRFWLDRPMAREPGTTFQYDSGGVICLSSIVKARTGDHADVLIESALFAPLGITDARWYRNQEGHPHMGGGLFLRSIDMAKFGQLYLQRGQWGEQQVLPARWVDESFRQRVTFDGGSGPFVGYGYLWWILPRDPRADDRRIYAAVGLYGQYIFVIPSREMVVAVTAGAETAAEMNRPIEFLYGEILPAVRD